MTIFERLDWPQLSEIFVYSTEKPLLFNSGLFLFLFLAFFGIYIILERNRHLRIIYTILFSLFFYYKSSGFYFWILIVSTFIDFSLGKLIYKSEKKAVRIIFLCLSLIANLGILGYFKYTNFFIDTFNSFLTSPIANFEIFLPVGISFYTFQTISYSIDVYRKKIKPENNILDFAFFVTFFPQLVAGPIVRAADFLPQIRKKIFVKREELGRGVLLIIGGLFKKAVISNYISVNFVDRVFETPLLYSGFENLMAVYGYAIQIYCDFSGYSDIAIGLALLLGFKIPINFNAPYKATSITDFWRRWHISLSSWLRDYLYISLGGNRNGKLKTYLNLMITMLLGGLWHGASWKFVAWGGLHGLALAVEKFSMSFFSFKSNFLTRFLGILITFHFVCFCWIFFRADSFSTSLEIINQITGYFKFSMIPEIVKGYGLVFFVIISGFVLHAVPGKLEKKLESIFINSHLIIKSLIFAVVLWIVLQTASSEIQPFIYFQF